MVRHIFFKKRLIIAILASVIPDSDIILSHKVVLLPLDKIQSHYLCEKLFSHLPLHPLRLPANEDDPAILHDFSLSGKE